MKVLVTGGSGFLGSHVAAELVKLGHDVRALVRKSSNKKFLESLDRVELAYGGVEEESAVAKAAEVVDAIVHSAALVKARDEDEFFRTNVQGTRNLIEAAKKQGGAIKRFVHVSSLEAAGPSDDGGPIPADQEKPMTRYGRSKLASEKVVLDAKEQLPVVILRPGGIYGPRDQEIADAFRSVKRGMLPLAGKGDTRYSLIYGPDAARACIRALDADLPSGKVFFLSDGKVYSQLEMMEIIERAWGKRALVRTGMPLGVIKTVSLFVEGYGKVRNKAVMLTREKSAMLGHHWVCAKDDIEAALGWKPEMSFEEGARVTARWYEENGWM